MIQVPVEIFAQCEGGFKKDEEFSMNYNGKEIEIVHFESNFVLNQLNSNSSKSIPGDYILINFSIVKKFRENINHHLSKEPEERIRPYEFEGEFTFKCSNSKVKLVILWAKFDSKYQNLSVSMQEV
ncbi:hypothetical protein pv_369 [Pithovirus sibericum]|uniref:Uncharacterized protein n=1 Tax=Pithovirus sibericum TaxID=1450746 RepID=W5SAX1_9VIRU|nr:hypothetical protein pv_369 [Pithovirus sibericum]AHH01935.1 hypothetical protein pv_369 [Pithovirus sibericum]